MSDDVKLFGIDNDEIQSGVFKKFQAKKGEIYRAGIVYSDPKVLFAGHWTHFHQRYFICKKGICCDKLGEPRMRMGAVIILYGTDKLGNPKSPLSYEILPWMFGGPNYNKLRMADSEFPIVSHDIKITGTNDEYRTVDIHVCKESIWQAKEEFKKKILEEAKPCWDFIKRNIAANLSVEEIKDLISTGPTGTAVDPASDMNLGDILAGV